MNLLPGMVVRILGKPHLFRACAEVGCTLPFCGEVDTVVEADAPDAHLRSVRLTYRDWISAAHVQTVCRDCRQPCEPVAYTINPASMRGHSITVYVCSDCAASRRAEG